MRELQNLDKHLLQSEFETGRTLYEAMRNQGYAPFKVAGMIYRHGYLDGKDSQRAKISEAYKKLYAKKPEKPDDASAEPEQPDNNTEKPDASAEPEQPDNNTEGSDDNVNA